MYKQNFCLVFDRARGRNRARSRHRVGLEAHSRFEKLDDMLQFARAVADFCFYRFFGSFVMENDQPQARGRVF